MIRDAVCSRDLQENEYPMCCAICARDSRVSAIDNVVSRLTETTWRWNSQQQKGRRGREKEGPRAARSLPRAALMQVHPCPTSTTNDREDNVVVHSAFALLAWPDSFQCFFSLQSPHLPAGHALLPTRRVWCPHLVPELKPQARWDPWLAALHDFVLRQNTSG